MTFPSSKSFSALPSQEPRGTPVFGRVGSFRAQAQFGASAPVKPPATQFQPAAPNVPSRNGTYSENLEQFGSMKMNWNPTPLPANTVPASSNVGTPAPPASGNSFGSRVSFGNQQHHAALSPEEQNATVLKAAEHISRLSTQVSTKPPAAAPVSEGSRFSTMSNAPQQGYAPSARPPTPVAQQPINVDIQKIEAYMQQLEAANAAVQQFLQLLAQVGQMLAETAEKAMQFQGNL